MCEVLTIFILNTVNPTIVKHCGKWLQKRINLLIESSRSSPYLLIFLYKVLLRLLIWLGIVSIGVCGFIFSQRMDWQRKRKPVCISRNKGVLPYALPLPLFRQSTNSLLWCRTSPILPDQLKKCIKLPFRVAFPLRVFFFGQEATHERCKIQWKNKEKKLLSNAT